VILKGREREREGDKRLRRKKKKSVYMCQEVLWSRFLRLVPYAAETLSDWSRLNIASRLGRLFQFRIPMDLLDLLEACIIQTLNS
jgi:hypothetical protein